MIFKRIAAATVSVLVAALCVWFALREVSWPELRAALSSVSPAGLGVATLAYLALLASHGWRTQVVLQSVTPARYGPVLAAYAVTSVLNLVAPVRSGDLFKARELSRATGATYAQCLALCAADILWWLLALIVSALLIGLFADVELSALRVAFLVLGAAGVLGYAAVFAIDRVWATRVSRPTSALLGRFWELVRALSQSLTVRVLVRALPIALVGWALEAVIVLAIADTCGLPLGFPRAFAVAASVTLAAAIPAPGGVGPFEAAATLSLAGAGSATAILTFALVYHAFLIVAPIACGALAMVTRRHTLRAP